MTKRKARGMGTRVVFGEYRQFTGERTAGRLVAGFRGTPAADVEALVDLLDRLGRLADDVPELTELDVNPVLAGPDGCVVVDARARVAKRSGTRSVKSW